MEDVADAHAHLAEMEGLKDVVQRAYKAGVYAILAVGMGYQSNQRTLKIAEGLVNSPVKILPSLGLHPCGLSEAEIESTIAHMRRNMISARAVGEVGLDYWLKDVRKDDYSKRVQERAFREAVRLARDFDKPVVVHSRGAWDECLRILVEEGTRRAVFHWFSGPLELLRGILGKGFFVSATPALKYSMVHRAAVRIAPLERLLLETDSPVIYGDLRAEPKDVIIPLQETAKLKALDETEVALKTTENFKALFV